MGRKRSFDRAQVLRLGMEQFWRRGFTGTSIQHLVKATGLKPQSLYNTYGSKQRFYLEALKRYRQTEEAAIYEQVCSRMAQQVTPLRAIWSICQQPPERTALGCMIVNASVEFGSNNHLVLAEIDAFRKAKVAILEYALEVNRTSGELRADTDTLALAHVLVDIRDLLLLRARSGSTPSQLQEIASSALSRMWPACPHGTEELSEHEKKSTVIRLN